MIFNIKFETVKNIEDKIQISISQETKVGEKIVSESLAEYPKDKEGNDISVVHPDKPYSVSYTHLTLPTILRV